MNILEYVKSNIMRYLLVFAICGLIAAMFHIRVLNSTIVRHETTISTLSTENGSLHGAIEQFKASIEEQNKAIEEAAKLKISLEERVTAANERIASLRRQRDKALVQVSKIPPPAKCDEKFDWLIDRAKELTHE